ncbi:MAG: ABC transporter permease subunit [Flavobacteriia bacterium]|nr:ABC transporter permease subunit [Flavobacteriia bacterium]OJX34832.1 MAG: gliding motility-associated ABC transporter permease subunit GldF [Flavobacteriia bacterium 40-80]
MKALYLKEIRSFLSSIIGYVFIVIFLVTSGIFHWVISFDTNLLEGTEADLIPFFNLSPVIFLILIPAITMRSFAEERRTGTIELLFTRPISDFQIVMAKFLAGVTLVLISLFPTCVYFFTMYYLGEPVGIIDEGATIVSYFGLLMLGSVFVSIGIFSSAVTSSQIVAFILSMFLCWFFYDGLEMIGSFGTVGALDKFFKYCSINYHFDSIKRGVIDTSDLLYFLGIIALFSVASLTVIKSLKK